MVLHKVRLHVETERQTVLYSKHFVTSQKCPYHVTYTLTLTHGCGLYYGPSCASLVAIQPYRTVIEILSFKGNWVRTLTFWGHVTSSVT